jgi:co-chaperonin GroES (HSP10)
LIRPINNKPLEKKSVIKRLDSKNQSQKAFKDFSGWHPFLAEVVNVSSSAKAKAIEKETTVDAGDIINVSTTLLKAMENGIVGVLFLDGEELLLIHYQDLQGTMNFYRDKVLKGEPII